MDAHQGRIWAEHSAGGGARFCLALPLGTPPSLPETEPQPEPEPEMQVQHLPHAH